MTYNLDHAIMTLIYKSHVPRSNLCNAVSIHHQAPNLPHEIHQVQRYSVRNRRIRECVDEVEVITKLELVRSSSSSHAWYKALGLGP